MRAVPANMSCDVSSCLCSASLPAQLASDTKELGTCIAVAGDLKKDLTNEALMHPATMKLIPENDS